jgi:REP element-mobilizing transposase RayT
MPFDSNHGHKALRRGRWSESGAEYFLTFCTDFRQPGLTNPNILSAVWSATSRLDQELAWHLQTGVVMPDHMHLLVDIYSSLRLAEAVRLFKGRLAPILRQAGLRWQPAYFDHRLRSAEDRLPIFMYIY